MAGGAILRAGNGGKDYPGKMTLFVFLACLVASSGGLIFGYDIGISGDPHITTQRLSPLLLRSSSSLTTFRCLLRWLLL
ncbi:hypothetical protein C4D60_Mb05t00990 [Musa balbisiana]|uniref:Major facilitator superfamily (MFS) profile domain-containing protein n=1 Tax=Musa balbisiana TaxID=52838 RepID=A0A4S8JSV2_MUSBA|nr:hypothetical protein C4D60_Mb05t00990 [Musa balbisiana]